MAFSTYNSIQIFLTNIGNVSYIYNFPSIDPSLVLYYPLDTSFNIGGISRIANYASGLPVYDASLIGSSITNGLGTFAIGYGDLSLNNTMGNPSANYVIGSNTFALNTTEGFSISLWFSCSGEVNKNGTLISLPSNSNAGIEIDISGTNGIFSGYN